MVNSNATTFTIRTSRVTPDRTEEHAVATPEGFACFVREHHLYLTRYFLRKRLQLEDAQDLTQETIMALWQRRQEWTDPHRTFMIKIARNVFFSFLRRRKIDMLNVDNAAREASLTMMVPADDDDPDALPQDNSLPPDLIARIRLLSQKQQRVIRMLYVEGMSQQQTAERMGVSRSSVQTHARRAIAILRGFAAQAENI